MDQRTDSIVASIKKMLGLEDEYTPFDMDVITHINAAFMTLTQMGIGPKEGFMVDDYNQTWEQFLTNKVMLGGVKTWVYLQVKMMFDPPSNSILMDAMKQQADQILWRLNVQAESVERMPFMTEDGLKRGANPINVGTEPEPGASDGESGEGESGNGSENSGSGGNWQGAQGGFEVEIVDTGNSGGGA